MPEGAVGGRRLTEGGSDDGGFEEVVELVLSRSSRSAIRCSSWPMTPAITTWASLESVSQMGCGIEVGLVIRPLLAGGSVKAIRAVDAYRHPDLEFTPGAIRGIARIV